MKTLLVDCSPKKSLSTSSYLLSTLSFQLTGEKEKLKLLPKNYDSVCRSMQNADAIVLAMPIYVDGVPASVLRFFEYVQNFRTENHLPPLKVYGLVNCGFYEGEQTKTCHRIIENWCNRCGFHYMGGVGQGAGEMIGIIRFVNPFIAIVGSLIQFIIIAILSANQLTFAEICQRVGFVNIAINIGLFFIFNIFMYIAIFKLAKACRHMRSIPVIYSTVFCPRFLFVIFADLFWIIRALLHGVPVWALNEKPAHKLKSSTGAVQSENKL